MGLIMKNSILITILSFAFFNSSFAQDEQEWYLSNPLQESIKELQAILTHEKLPLSLTEDAPIRQIIKVKEWEFSGVRGKYVKYLIITANKSFDVAVKYVYPDHHIGPVEPKIEFSEIF